MLRAMLEESEIRRAIGLREEGDRVARNVRIASNASVTAGVIIGGHAVIELNSWLGMTSSIREGRHVGPYALVGMDASVQQDLAENMVARGPRPDVRARDDDDDRSTIGFPQR